MPTKINEDLLIAAATEVFAERGYAGAGVAEIARRAGVTTGAIYSRYTGKSELLLEALDRSFGQHLEAILSSSESDTPTELLASLGSHLLDQHGGEDALFLEAIVASRRDKELSEMLGRRLEDMGMRYAKIIEEAKTDGQFDQTIDTAAIVTFIQAISLGFTIFRTLNTPMPDPDEWQIVINTVIASALPTTTG
ncbi:MAG: TetR/AcrR family transcriptional regulator [Acidimicrobiales bacterium]|jgi:AcrR family transcriptional regulator|nr:TetR/AcrR family transcriptional regulator [Acidimicrobiales bacterium]MDP6297961.1 TetR/AcrR family transcriptional regulator [Acidimicrobiales bacterium]HJM27928.1 TetR/AcrR family transcriptional regulator [Acidimicrobiales bacterium]HJM97928.1 TetR/AcrR family transcriptional regulator [Acidimicrobiales bacterium]